MAKNLSGLCIGLFLATIVITTVTSFGDGVTSVGGFGYGNDDNRKYQTWQDKRGLTANPASVAFGQPLASRHFPRFLNWRDLLASAVSKRHMHFGSRSFGGYRRYFANDGLQDWKTTRTGKREVLPA